jgi:chemotaxis response regulator CheB
VIAVLLTGMLDDGTAGLWDVRRRGGITIVQDPASADHPGMPGSALFHGSPHYCLPLSAIAETLGRLVSDTEALGRERRKPRVLIVEDEAVVALNLEERLGDLGYEVVGAMSSGEEAVRIAAEVCPDIVLMDVHLSGTMTGTEAGRVLWERHALPIVYLTAYSDEGTLAETKASMPYGFIVKPYRPAQIQAALKLALDRREREISRAG